MSRDYSITNFSTRDYQQELIDKTLDCWLAGRRRVMMQLPTRAGKTVIFQRDRRSVCC